MKIAFFILLWAFIIENCIIIGFVEWFFREN